MRQVQSMQTHRAVCFPENCPQVFNNHDNLFVFYFEKAPAVGCWILLPLFRITHTQLTNYSMRFNMSQLITTCSLFPTNVSTSKQSTYIDGSLCPGDMELHSWVPFYLIKLTILAESIPALRLPLRHLRHAIINSSSFRIKPTPEYFWTPRVFNAILQSKIVYGLESV